MAKRKRIKKLTWGKLWTKLKKLGWRFERPKGLATENRYFTPAGWEKRPHATHLVDYYEGPDEVWKHLPEDVLYDDAAGADGASEPPPSTRPPATQSDASPAQSPARAPAKAPAKSPAQSPVKSPAQIPAQSPALPPATSPAKSPSRPPARAPPKTPMRTPPKKRARKAIASATPSPQPSPRVPPPTRVKPSRSARHVAETVDISVGNDRMTSGDEDDYAVDDDGAVSDIEASSEISSSEDEETSDEEDAVDLSAWTPFDKMTKEQLSEHAKTGWTTFFEAQCTSLQIPAADLARASAAPTQLAQALGCNLEGLFFLFLPKEMWLAIATESNRYQLQYREQAAEEIMARQQRIKDRRPAYKMKTLQQVQKEQRAFKPIQAHELVNFIGLLCARTLCPHKEKLAKHWAVDAQGAVPKGTFGRYMARKRFEEIVRFLHFSDNSHADAVKFKTWKIKPIADTINTTFKLGMTVGQRIAFDEGMIPMRSKYNPMRQYLRGNPRPWGTKCFLTCDADTGYCYRAEIYQGKVDRDCADLNQGPNAVLRNVDAVLDGLPKKRLIITDRFYSSVLLSSILLQRGLYHVGTIQTNRRGYCKVIPYKSAKRPKNMARGSYRIAQSKDEPSMIAVSWMDNRPVHFIATGCSTEPATLSRREGSAVVDVPAPRLVKEYQDGMGGADVHDQLRLQRYSIQGAMKMRKYYHTIFLGLVDMALINAFIIFRRVQGDRTTGPAQPTHAHFMRVMQMSLLAVGASDFEGDLSVRALTDTPVPPSPTPRYRYRLSTSHSTKQVEVYRTTRGKNGKESRKRRQYACKVCSLLRPAKNPWETTFYCFECTEARLAGTPDDSSSAKGKIYLCQKVRQHDPTAATNSATCSQIWHELWGGGANIPPGLKSIRLRAPVDQGAQASDGHDDVSSVSSGARSGSDEGSPAEGIVEPAVI